MNFKIPIVPVTKKNHQQIITIKGRPMLIQSKQYRDYEKSAGIYCPKMNINFPVNVKAIFNVPTKRRVDLTNLLEALDDVLTRSGTLVDDSAIPAIIVSHDGSRVVYDKGNGYTEVEISVSEDQEVKNEN